MWVLAYALLGLFLLLIVVFLITWRLEKKTNTPGIGIFASVLQGTNLLKTTMNIVKEKRITKGFVHSWLGSKLQAIAVDPEAVKFVLKSPDIAKTKGFQSRSFEGRFGEDLAFANGDVWKKQRAVVNSAFNSKAYQTYHPIFVNTSNKAVQLIAQAAAAGQDVEVASLMQRFTLDLLGYSIFHYDFGCMDNKFDEYYNHYKYIVSHLIHAALLNFVPFIHYAPIPVMKQFEASTAKLYSFFHKLVDEHRKNKSSNDILDHMLAAADDPVSGLSTIELYSNIYLFFLAGHETTALALTTAIYELSEHPEVQERIFQEISSVIGDRTPEFSDLQQLKYLDCFINENHRVHPPATLVPTRIALKDLQYNDQFIPKGTIVGMEIEAVHFNPDYWKDPQKFDPDRFLPENRKGRHNFAFLPFSMGPRMCIGNDFSLNEQRVLLAELIKKFKILPPKTRPSWKHISEEIKFGNPNASLKIQFVPRK